MATIDRRPNGKWRAQVRREGHDLSKTFVMKADADTWVRDIGRAIEKGEDPTARPRAAAGTFGAWVDQHIE